MKLHRVLKRLLRAALALAGDRSLDTLVVKDAFQRHPPVILDVVMPNFNRGVDLDSAPVDIQREGRLEFDDFAGLFASSSFNHGVIGMTIRQGAYLFGLCRGMPVRRAIEIGRFRGGSTVLIAAGMDPEGILWSIDLGEKEERFARPGGRPFDEQIRDFCDRHGFSVEILVGDSRTIEVTTGEVDLVLIDGDHSYEGVRSDFERFGRRIRQGGAVLLDDAFDEALFPSHSDTVGRLVEEIVAKGEFELVGRVDRMAHLARVG
jgi:predicted O-methyltransferase YrrM